MQQYSRLLNQSLPKCVPFAALLGGFVAGETLFSLRAANIVEAEDKAKGEQNQPIRSKTEELSEAQLRKILRTHGVTDVRVCFAYRNPFWRRLKAFLAKVGTPSIE